MFISERVAGGKNQKATNQSARPETSVDQVGRLRPIEARGRLSTRTTTYRIAPRKTHIPRSAATWLASLGELPSSRAVMIPKTGGPANAKSNVATVVFVFGVRLDGLVSRS